MKETRKPVRKPRTRVVSRTAAEPAPAKGKTAVRKKAAVVLPQGLQPPAGYDDNERIRVAAYYLAERRGFVSGHALDDWLAAEAEVRAGTASPRGVRQATERRRSAKTK